MPGFAFPSVGPLGLSSPPSRSGLSLTQIIGTMLSYDCHLSVSVLFAFRCRSPIPLPCSLFLCVPFPACHIGWKPPYDTKALVHPVPLLFWRSWGGRHLALPSSRIVPLNVCPALRPRWCPACSPFRLQDCCLPFRQQRRLSQFVPGYPLSTTIYYFGVLSHGLRSCSTQFRTSITGFARGFHY